MPILTDLVELKTILSINPGDKSEDRFLMFLAEYATNIITEVLDRPGLFLDTRTEYYSGTGTQKLCLNSRPVYATPNPIVIIDHNGNFGATSGSFSPSSDLALTWGGTNGGFTMIMPDGVKSRSGILVRINAYWPKPSARQTGLLTPFMTEAFGNIKVTYKAGYTVDDLPAAFRLAANSLVASLRQTLPYGFYLTSESYEDRSVSYLMAERRKFLAMAWQYIGSYRNWHW